MEQWYPELGPGASLWCATEVTTRVQMDAVAEALDFVTASVTEAEPVMAAKADAWISRGLSGRRLKSVAFVEDFLELRFGTPCLTLFDWPHVLLDGLFGCVW